MMRYFKAQAPGQLDVRFLFPAAARLAVLCMVAFTILASGTPLAAQTEEEDTAVNDPAAPGIRIGNVFRDTANRDALRLVVRHVGTVPNAGNDLQIAAVDLNQVLTGSAPVAGRPPAATDGPIYYTLLVDNTLRAESGLARRGQTAADAYREAIEALMRTLDGPQVVFRVRIINGRGEDDQLGWNDRQTIDDWLDGRITLQQRWQQSPILGLLGEEIRALAGPGEAAHRELIAITDGVAEDAAPNTDATRNAEEVIRQARLAGVVASFFAVSGRSRDPIGTGQQTIPQTAAMRAIASETGGLYEEGPLGQTFPERLNLLGTRLMRMYVYEMTCIPPVALPTPISSSQVVIAATHAQTGLRDQQPLAAQALACTLGLSPTRPDSLAVDCRSHCPCTSGCEPLPANIPGCNCAEVCGCPAAATSQGESATRMAAEPDKSRRLIAVVAGTSAVLILIGLIVWRMKRSADIDDEAVPPRSQQSGASAAVERGPASRPPHGGSSISGTASTWPGSPPLGTPGTDEVPPPTATKPYRPARQPIVTHGAPSPMAAVVLGPEAARPTTTDMGRVIEAVRAFPAMPATGQFDFVYAVANSKHEVPRVQPGVLGQGRALICRRTSDGDLHVVSVDSESADSPTHELMLVPRKDAAGKVVAFTVRTSSGGVRIPGIGQTRDVPLGVTAITGDGLVFEIRTTHAQAGSTGSGPFFHMGHRGRNWVLQSVTTPPDSPTRLVVDEIHTVLGRAPEASDGGRSRVLMGGDAESGISRNHALVWSSNGYAFIARLNTVTDLLVNEVAVAVNEVRQLGPGDTIQFLPNLIYRVTSNRSSAS